MGGEGGRKSVDQCKIKAVTTAVQIRVIMKGLDDTGRLFAYEVPVVGQHHERD
jgi:hypothetical protein